MRNDAPLQRVAGAARLSGNIWPRVGVTRPSAAAAFASSVGRRASAGPS